MSRNAVKTEAAAPYAEQTRLGGPIPVVMGGGAAACRVKLSGRLLEAAGMLPRDLIEVTARAGEILIKRIAEAEPLAWSAPRPASPAQQEMDQLMRWTKERQARLDGDVDEVGEGDETGDGLGLNEDQVNREEL